MPRLFDTLKGSCGKEVVVGARRIATQRVALNADDMGLPPPAAVATRRQHYLCSAPFIMSGALPRPGTEFIQGRPVVYLMHAIAGGPRGARPGGGGGPEDRAGGGG